MQLMIVDGVDMAESERVLRHCVRVMPPGFFSDLTIVGHFANYRPPPDVTAIDTGEPNPNFYRWNVWALRELYRYVVTPHVMMLHRDGFIVNPSKWSDDFLQYDWVGAPWRADGNGGNDGFSIKTRRFMEWLSQHPAPMPYGAAEDVWCCENLQAEAVAAGFKYAPLEVNLRFSLEFDIAGHPRALGDAFGFHGKWHAAAAKKMVGLP